MCPEIPIIRYIHAKIIRNQFQNDVSILWTHWWKLNHLNGDRTILSESDKGPSKLLNELQSTEESQWEGSRKNNVIKPLKTGRVSRYWK